MSAYTTLYRTREDALQWIRSFKPSNEQLRTFVKILYSDYQYLDRPHALVFLQTELEGATNEELGDMLDVIDRDNLYNYLVVDQLEDYHRN
jgi:hypothetical protein